MEKQNNDSQDTRILDDRTNGGKMIIHIGDNTIKDGNADESRDWLVDCLTWTLEMKNPEDENEVLEKIIDIREISSFVIRKKTTPPAKNMVSTIDVHLKSGTIFTTSFRQGSRALEVWKAYLWTQFPINKSECIDELYSGDYGHDGDFNYEAMGVQK